MTRPSQRREMAENAVARHKVSIALACRAFGVSETCYRYSPKLKGENEEIADLLARDDRDPSRPYGAALKDLGRGDDREIGRWLNNWAENSHLPFRRLDRAMLRFRRMRTLQKFASIHDSVHNQFPTERHLQNRNTTSRPAPPLLPSGAAFSQPEGSAG